LHPLKVQYQDQSYLEKSQKQEQKTKKIENTRFNEVRQIAYVLREERREILLIRSPIHVIKYRNSQYIASEKDNRRKSNQIKILVKKKLELHSNGQIQLTTCEASKIPLTAVQPI